MTQEMTPYVPKPMSRRELRKCYSRFSISVILVVALTQCLGAGLYYAAVRFFPQYYWDAFWGPVLALAINDVSVYLPGLVIFPLVLRKIPKGNPIPVDRLSLWEFVQATVFSFGVGYGCSLLTSLVITVLEHLTSHVTTNVVDSFSASLPIWLTAVAFVLVAPVMEELLFRRILLRRLLGLGGRIGGGAVRSGLRPVPRQSLSDGLRLCAGSGVRGCRAADRLHPGHHFTAHAHQRL